MSLPEFPTITPPLSREDAINQIISSIAMEELGLSHIINAEGEKLQYVLGTIPGISGPSATIEDVLKVNESVRGVLQNATESQTLLRSKLQQALTSGVLTGPTGPIGPTGPATISVNTNVARLEPDQNPTVTGTGDENVVLSFGIPRGYTGEPGPAGPAGPTGAFEADQTLFVASGTSGATAMTLGARMAFQSADATVDIEVSGGSAIIDLSANIGAYGSFVGNIVRTLAAGGVVTLDAAPGSVVGMSFTTDSPSSAVTINNEGVYRIGYGIVAEAIGGTTGTMQLTVNGEPITTTAVVLPISATPIELSGAAILSVGTGYTVGIGTTDAVLTLAANNSAFLDIVKMA